MARVDFYVLRQSGEQARMLFACRLAEKAYRLDNSVHIHASNGEAARQIDAQLWTFRDGSFVPHHCLGDSDLESPVTIGCDGEVRSCDLLINLSDELPSFAGDFERVAELVTADEQARQSSRERFVEYRNRGHEIETHKL